MLHFQLPFDSCTYACLFVCLFILLLSMPAIYSGTSIQFTPHAFVRTALFTNKYQVTPHYQMLDDKSRQKMVWNGCISIKISDLVAKRLIRNKLCGKNRRLNLYNCHAHTIEWVCNLVTNVIHKFVIVIRTDRANIGLKFIDGHVLVQKLNL